MDKNDFDIDFDFEKEYGFDPETLLNTDDAGDFDLSQFDDDLDPMGDSEQAESENFNFEDFDLDEELANADEDPDLTYDDYAAEEQTEQPGDEAYAEAEDYGEDVYLTRKNRQGEAAGEYDGEHPQSPYPDMEEDVPQEEPQVPGLVYGADSQAQQSGTGVYRRRRWAPPQKKKAHQSADHQRGVSASTVCRNYGPACAVLPGRLCVQRHKAEADQR